jgi:hypothetical protein
VSGPGERRGGGRQDRSSPTRSADETADETATASREDDTVLDETNLLASSETDLSTAEETEEL